MPPVDKAYGRRFRAGEKYKEIDGGKWIIDINKDRGSVRPIDLVHGDPNQEPHILRKFDDKETAIAFEEECFKEKERLIKAGGDWSRYRYIQRKKLKISHDQRALHDNLVNEMRDNAAALHERHDEAEQMAIEHKAEILAESAETKAAAEKNGSKLNQVIGMLRSKTKGHAGPQWSAIIIDIRVREPGIYWGLSLKSLHFSWRQNVLENMN